MKIAFVFPGQGSQYVGMGKDLFDNIEEVKEIYKEASESLGYDVGELSFNGPKDELNKTFRTQPCLLTASFAAYKALTWRGIHPSFVAGHSLGEYTAIAAAGIMSFKDTIRITEKRGRFMQEAVPEGRGLMAAVIGLDREAINKICASTGSGYVAPANFNCPGQIVLAGEKEAVEQAVLLAKEAGARKAVPLAVSAPSHCKLMKPASDKLSDLLDGIDLQAPQIPIVTNADAVSLKEPDVIKDSMVRQLNSPLLWEDAIQYMANEGVDTVIEVGPKKVLSGLIRRINGDLKLYNVEDSATLDATVAALS